MSDLGIVSTFFNVDLEKYEIVKPLGSKGIVIVRKETYNDFKPKMYLEPEVIEEIIRQYKEPVKPINAFVKKKEKKEPKVDPIKPRKKRKKNKSAVGHNKSKTKETIEE